MEDRDKEILYLWNSSLLNSLDQSRGCKCCRVAHRSQMPSYRVSYLDLKGGGQDTLSRRGCRREIKPSFSGGGGRGK